MKGRDRRGNTEEEIMDLFFVWLDKKAPPVPLFDELPVKTFSDLVVYHISPLDVDNHFYVDEVFALWTEKVYNK